MKAKSTAEALRFYKREERKLKIKAMLEKDPEKRADLEAQLERTRERRANMEYIEKCMNRGRVQNAMLKQ